MKTTAHPFQQAHQSKANAHRVARQPTSQGRSFKPTNARALAFEDKRPEAAAQRQLHALANNSPQVRQLRALQDMANKSLRGKQRAEAAKSKRSSRTVNAGAVAQRRIADCSNGQKISGFTRTTAFRSLPEKAQAYFQVLYNDPQYRYTFASRAEIIKYVQKDPTAQKPTMEILEKDYDSGITPFEEGGASSIENLTKATEQHQHHWRDYFHMHANIAYKKATTTKAQESIKGIYQHYKDQAVMMDDSEIYYQMDLDSEAIEEIRKAPIVMRAALEIMYETANETVFFGGLDTGALSIPKFGSMTPSGIGTSAEITINRNGSFPQGSGAAPEHGANPYWYQQLNKRRNINGGNQYIRGHLLNDHMGGPARPYNLVPLASDANMAHFGLIEKKAKQALVWMIKSRSTPTSPSLSDINSIYYWVGVLEQGQNRPT